MLSTWLPRFLVPIAIALAFAQFRRMAPARARMAEHRYDKSQILEPLPSGVIGGAMWSVGIALAMLFFVLRAANHLRALLEGPSLLTQYAPQVFWCFLPGFAALSIPWPLTVWYGSIEPVGSHVSPERGAISSPPGRGVVDERIGDLALIENRQPLNRPQSRVREARFYGNSLACTRRLRIGMKSL
jgi:hypothetical protein